MEIIKSIRGGDKLLFEGFSYTKKKTRKTSIHWECSKRKTFSCKGSLITDSAVTAITSSTPHSHESDIFATEALKVRQEIKDRVKFARANPGQLVSDTLSEYPVNVRVAAGKVDTIKRSVRRVNSRLNAPEPASITEIPDLPEQFTGSGGPDNFPFLLYGNYDNYAKDQVCENRISLFGSEEGLSHLCNSKQWFMDGTFDTAPKQFKKVFVIRAAVDDVYATCVYAFLPNKQESTYEEFLTAVLNACDERGLIPDPESVTCDFEIRIHNAIRSMLGEHVKIQGCFYHLTQSTWRKIQNEGLSVLYKSSDDVKHFCGMLDGLAFLPTDRVTEGMSFLRSDIPDGFQGVVDYFDSYYVSGVYKATRGPRGVLKFKRTGLPLYQPNMWNVHDITLSGGSRTNNICESWNNSFTHLVGHKNPSLWHTIRCFQKDHLNALTEIERLRIGDPVRKRMRKETVLHQKKLHKLCSEFSNGQKSIPEFLSCVGHIVRL